MGRGGRQHWTYAERPAAAVVSLHSPLGELFVAASETAVVASAFDERSLLDEVMGRGFEAAYLGAPSQATDLAISAREELAEYFGGARRDFRTPLDFGEPTVFAHAVLEEVAGRIPFGQTATYGDIGERAGRLRAARAVGNIMASCGFSVLVPCHRVVHTGLTAHERGGEGHFSSRKAWLLRFEREAMGGDPTR